MLAISEIYLFRSPGLTGTFSVKFVYEKFDFFINEIKLDANNGVEPISYYKVNGNQIVCGSYFELLKRQLIKLFKQEIFDDSFLGMFKWDSISNKVVKV